MKNIGFYVCTAISILILSSCSYNSELKKSHFNENCPIQKAPLKLGFVSTNNTKDYSIHPTVGACNSADIKVSEALRKSIYDILKCNVSNVRLIDNPNEYEDADVYTYCTYSYQGNEVLLELILKERQNDSIIHTYRVKQPVKYDHPGFSGFLGFLTVMSLGTIYPITGPIMCSLNGSAWEDAISNNMQASINTLNDQLKIDNKLQKYAKDKINNLTTGSSQSSSNVNNKNITPSSIYDDIMRCVVIIRTNQGMGSGFFIKKEGIIVTNSHVVGNESRVSVLMKNKETLLGQVIEVDKGRDLALVSVTGNDFHSLALGDIEKEGNVGSEVMAIGVPEGLSWSLSKGIISAVRDLEDVQFVQTDAAINHGNSGGPLIALNSGRVIGINSFIVRKDIATGLNFAVSASELRKAFPTYIK